MARSRSRRTPLSSVREEVPESPKLAIDGADVTAGVVLALALPILTVVLLATAGLRLSGRESLTTEERIEREERLSERKSPPLRAEEVERRMQHVDRLVRENASIYLQRFRSASDDPRASYPWYTRAYTVYRSCDEILSTLQKNLEENLGAGDAALLQRIRDRRSKIQTELDDLEREKPFLDG